MQRLLLILLSLLLACTSTPPADTSSTATSKGDLPNIILLVGDDQGYPYFGFMGADYVQTPQMDRLAASGVLFTQGYVPENHCRPSLQTLMTGTLPIDYNREVEEMIKADTVYQALPEAEQAEWARNFRFHAMQHMQTLPQMLREKGYVSFQGGKWWEYNYQNGGFDHGMTKGWSKEEEKDPDWFLQFMGGEGTELARATMQPVYDFIDAEGDQPMFIWFAPELPHYPFDAPAKYYDLYRDQAGMTESAKRYYANCTWFDDGVGELIRYLKEKGEFANTLFVYVNDNGWEQEPDQEFRHDSLRWHNGGDKGKLSIYDQSFRTPIIFSWPGHIPQGVVKTDLIHSADIPATLLDYVGLTQPEALFGQSYRSVIEGEGKGPRAQILGNVNQIRWEGDMMGKQVEGYWFRNEKWFFRWNVTTDEQALYDMTQDPKNDHNVAEVHPDEVASLLQTIEVWKAAHGGR